MVKIGDSISCLCLGVAIMLRFRILGGVVDGIILTRVLCNSNVGFLYKDTKRVFKGSITIIERYTSVCVKGELEDQGKWAILY